VGVTAGDELVDVGAGAFVPEVVQDETRSVTQMPIISLNRGEVLSDFIVTPPIVENYGKYNTYKTHFDGVILVQS